MQDVANKFTVETQLSLRPPFQPLQQFHPKTNQENSISTLYKTADICNTHTFTLKSRQCYQHQDHGLSES